MYRVIRNRIIAISFCVVLATIAVVSDYNIESFYINDKTNNNDWMASTEGKFETDYISNFCGKYQYVNMNGFVRKILNQHEMNGVVKLNNGFLMSPFEAIPQEKIENYARKTEKFNYYLAEKDIQYLYLTVPYTDDKYHSQLPGGIADYGNDNLDAIQEAMVRRGVEVLDLRECLYDQNMTTYDIVYKTDHHWTSEGGFWVYLQLIRRLEEIGGYEVPPYIKDIGNYDIEKYKEWHLGSFGQRTGRYYAGIDDFHLLVPKFDTYLEQMNEEKSGRLEEVMYDKSALSVRDYSSRYTYDNVLLTTKNWHNPEAPVDKRVLIIGDSMSASVMPYLALTYTDVMWILDTSSAQINPWYIEKNDPNIVISMYHHLWISDYAYNWGIY